MTTLSVDAAFITVTFPQASSPGAISISGLKVGDVMLSLSFQDTGSPRGNASVLGNGWYEAVVSVDDELQQNISTSPSGNVLTAVFYRGS